jgi:hypothetical protein
MPFHMRSTAGDEDEDGGIVDVAVVAEGGYAVERGTVVLNVDDDDDDAMVLVVSLRKNKNV